MSRQERQSSISGDEANPIKSDAQLKMMVKKLDRVKKYKSFQRWKTSFLDRLDQFLYDAGIEPAEKACSDFDDSLKRLVAETTKVLDFIHKGDLTDEKKTVKATLSLNEMCNDLENVRGEMEMLIPSLKSEERRLSYSKFHLGAALIRQNFHQYVSMKAIEDAVTEIGEKLENVADRQQHDLFEYYKKQFKRFCDILADMSLYTIMLKCVEFGTPPDHDESDDPEYFWIVVESNGTYDKLPMEVEPRDTISSIKEAISAGMGIPGPRQLLKYKGDLLDDDTKTIEALKIQDGDVMFVEPMTIAITVNAPDGKQIQLRVDPGIHLSDLKRQLEAESDISAKNQSISKGGKELNDPNATLDECGVKDGTILDLAPRVISVKVRMPSNKIISVELSPKDDVPALKALIESKSGMEARRQALQFGEHPLEDEGVSVSDLGLKEGSIIDVDVFKAPITVNAPDGEIDMAVDPFSILSDLKRDLEAVTGISAKNQHLTNDSDELHDLGKSLHDLNIGTGTVLTLEPKSITVHVNLPDGSKCDVEISPSDTSANIKGKIAAKTGMAAPRQAISINGKEFADDAVARDVGLREGATVDVAIFKIPVNVNTWDGKVIKIMVEPTDKLLDLKALLETDSGLPPKNQLLSMGDTALSDDNKRANSYGITEGSTLTLEPRYVEITVEVPDGTSFVVEVSAQSTGDEIKEQVEKRTGIVASRQVLHFSGKEILADSTVKGMGIKGGATLKCSLFKIPVTVETKDGMMFHLEVEPVECIDGIKAMLEPLSGLSPRKQVLSFVEHELNIGTRTATAYGIKKGSVLQLEQNDDPIVFVDVKYGALFGVDRGEVIELGILTLDQGNPLEFKQAEKTSAGKDKLCKAMLDSPNLGVKPQIVVEKMEIQDYDLEEAENVKSKWGVQLKKTEKNKRGEELIYVDVKTGGFGLVDRTTAIEKGFITVVMNGKEETLKEAEHNTRTYDKYVSAIRRVFGIKATK
jgi:Ubiquitin family/Ubiquitin-like domain